MKKSAMFSFQLLIFSPWNLVFGKFIVSFQSKGELSTNEWAKYTGKIPPMKEFTSCHWEKIRYFASDYTAVWGYCQKASKEGQGIDCTQFYHRGDPLTMNRHIKVYGWIGGKTQTTASIKNYSHRQWNHFCWQYSSITGHSMFYFNGQLVDLVETNENSTIGSDDNNLPSALIIGQEQDSISGRYELSQIFIGDISALNIWDYLLGTEVILNISKCRRFVSGNIANWDKEKYLVNKARVIDIEDENMFCKREVEFALFKQSETLENAKTLCVAYGGRIASPQNLEENNAMLEILSKHGSHCLNMKLPIQKGRALWLGFQRINDTWFITNDDNPIKKASFENWDKFTPLYPDIGCTFLQTDGYWGFRDKTSCSGLELCTICMFEETPVISLKGELCGLYSPHDYNYYLYINSSYQVERFLGYKTYGISQMSDGWKSEAEGANISLQGQGNPLGRQTWTWYNRRCSVGTPSIKVLSLSVCEFGTEFTCKSGRCISIERRCNQVKDCKDGSDEDDCELIRIPNNYNKIQAPGNTDEQQSPLPIQTKLHIIHVDMINTARMLLGLTIEITMKWADSRLTFANLNRRKKNPVPKYIVDQLWLPLDNVIQENAVIGKIYRDDIQRVFVTPVANPIPLNRLETFEEHIYRGSENPMEISQRFRVEYDCLFRLEKFPFDTQQCNLTLKMMLQTNNSIMLVPDIDPIVYNGEMKVGQFYIGNLSVTTVTHEEETRFVGIINLTRIFNYQLTNSFVPTILLWLIAYSTLFIGIDQFNVRFMGTLTSLLVLSSLLSSISKSLPTTSYFKFIDLWFLWYLANIFCMVLHHVYVNMQKSKFKKDTTLRPGNNVIVVSEMTKEAKNADHSFKKTKMCKENSEQNGKVNIFRRAIIIFPVEIIIFNFIYFILTTNM